MNCWLTIQRTVALPKYPGCALDDQSAVAIFVIGIPMRFAPPNGFKPCLNSGKSVDKRLALILAFNFEMNEYPLRLIARKARAY